MGNLRPSRVPSPPSQDAVFEAGCSWQDDVWRFPVTTAGTSASVYSVRWGFEVAAGRSLTEPRHRIMLESLRTVLWSVLVEPLDGKARKASICGRYSTGMRAFVPWLLKTGRTDLSGIDGDCFQEFFEHVQGLCIADTDDGEADLKDITTEAMMTYFVPFLYVHLARRALAEAGLPHPGEDDPMGGRALIDVAGTICRRAAVQTAEVPDAVFVKTVNTASSLFEEQWVEPLIGLWNRMASPTLDRGALEVLCREFINGWLEDVDPRSDPIVVVRAARQRLHTACQTLVQALSALRVSELCGIRTKGRTGASGLPDCIVVERTFDDAYEIFRLDALLFKDTTGSEPVQWVLGMRPTGSDYLPPPVRAIVILCRLDDGWRRLAGVDALLVGFSTVGRVLSAAEVKPMSSAAVRVSQQNWMAERGCIGDDEWITTHRWRKTFCRYLVRVSAALLPAISHHLKHLSIAMTEVGYCKADPATRKLVGDARVEEAGCVILGVITGEARVEGPVAAEIRAFGKEIGRRLGNRPSESLREDVTEAVKERRIQFYGSDFGWCVFRSEGARCHQLANDPTPPLLRLAPAFAERRPAVCGSCANFAIGAEHEPFWRSRKADLEARLAACGDDAPLGIRRSLTIAVGHSATVLSWMGGGSGQAED